MPELTESPNQPGSDPGRVASRGFLDQLLQDAEFVCKSLLVHLGQVVDPFLDISRTAGLGSVGAQYLAHVTHVLVLDQGHVQGADQGPDKLSGQILGYDYDLAHALIAGQHSDHALKETIGGEFRVFRAIRLL